MSSYGHFSVLLSFFLFFVTLFIASLPGVSTYLFPLHFHVVRVAFSFPAMSYSTDNFFLQTVCADCIKNHLLVQWLFILATVSGVVLFKRDM